LTTPIAKAPWRTFPAVIKELAEKFGDTPALISDDESLSFRALHECANHYARWVLARDIRKGDTVCLLMENRPEYYPGVAAEVAGLSDPVSKCMTIWQASSASTYTELASQL
jgi:non-ribosomal peptide synthetase component E (peptide arylation enzyme)